MNGERFEVLTYFGLALLGFGFLGIGLGLGKCAFFSS